MITHKLFNRIKGTDKKERKVFSLYCTVAALHCRAHALQSTSSEKTASSGSDKEAERKEKKERKKREKELKKEKKKASDEEKKEKREKEKEQKEKKSKDKKEKEEGSRVRFNLYPQSHGSAIAGRPAPLASPMVCT
jgi:outer membrane biosynthesis protein TonB